MSGIFSNTKIISEEQVSSMEEVAQNIEGFVEHHKGNFLEKIMAYQMGRIKDAARLMEKSPSTLTYTNYAFDYDISKETATPPSKRNMETIGDQLSSSESSSDSISLKISSLKEKDEVTEEEDIKVGEMEYRYSSGMNSGKLFDEAKWNNVAEYKETGQVTPFTFLTQENNILSEETSGKEDIEMPPLEELETSTDVDLKEETNQSPIPSKTINENKLERKEREEIEMELEERSLEESSEQKKYEQPIEVYHLDIQKEKDISKIEEDQSGPLAMSPLSHTSIDFNESQMDISEEIKSAIDVVENINSEEQVLSATTTDVPSEAKDAKKKKKSKKKKKKKKSKKTIVVQTKEVSSGGIKSEGTQTELIKSPLISEISPLTKEEDKEYIVLSAKSKKRKKKHKKSKNVDIESESVEFKGEEDVQMESVVVQPFEEINMKSIAFKHVETNDDDDDDISLNDVESVKKKKQIKVINESSEDLETDPLMENSDIILDEDLEILSSGKKSNHDEICSEDDMTRQEEKYVQKTVFYNNTFKIKQVTKDKAYNKLKEFINFL